MTRASRATGDESVQVVGGPGSGSVMTFNLGRGASGPAGTGPDDLDRVAEVIAADGGVDVAALQEVHAADVPILVEALEKRHGVTGHAHFTATVPEARMRASLARARDRGDAPRVAHLEGRQSDYGIGVLSRGPITEVHDHSLPDDRREPRKVQVVTTSIGGVPLTVMNTHLGLVSDRSLVDLVTFRPAPQRAQTLAVLALAGRNRGPVIALGDLNQVPAVLAEAVRRTSLQVASDPTRPTCGRRVLDHVLVSSDIAVLGAEVRDVPVSDHRPVVVRIQLPVDADARG